MSIKKYFFLLLFIAIVSVAPFLLNYATLQIPMNSIIKDDYRNEGIDISVHYAKYLIPTILVINVRKINHLKRPADVFRVFLQYAQKIKNKNFNSIILSSKGNKKFLLDGNYFQKLGSEYEYQNVVYTIRTFPQNVLNIDGSAAFSTWTGGVFGVTSKQLADFSDFHVQWYIEDLR